MEVLTAEEMRSVDRRAIDELGIPGLLLMESAGRSVAEAVRRDFPARLARIWIVCGKGNNGGDGLVAARHLVRQGIGARVLLLAAEDELRGDAAVNLRAARASGVPVRAVTSDAEWESATAGIGQGTLVVDAILGTGVRGGARGLAARAIADLNSCDVDVVAIDLPSGVDADRAERPPSASTLR